MVKAYLKFDIMCVIVSLLIMCPLFIEPVRKVIPKKTIIAISLVLIIMGICSIVYQQNETADEIVFDKYDKRYIYFGTTLLLSGILNIIYLATLYKIGS